MHYLEKFTTTKGLTIISDLEILPKMFQTTLSYIKTLQKV